ncbi:hypothetical protein AB0F17_52765 [Nonomuraea sp. NPDC026600]|uniref:hypothetical protein n=1 Tax=Nonomuraea sp. NPDC026600 TaxID=3155363 RepID=UPI0033F8E180
MSDTAKASPAGSGLSAGTRTSAARLNRAAAPYPNQATRPNSGLASSGRGPLSQRRPWMGAVATGIRSSPESSSSRKPSSRRVSTNAGTSTGSPAYSSARLAVSSMVAPFMSAAITTPPTAGIEMNVPASRSPTSTSSPSFLSGFV